MRLKKAILVVLFAVGLGGVFCVSPSYAADAKVDVSGEEPAGLPEGNKCATLLADFCKPGDRGGAGIFALLKLIINILTVGIGIVATIGIVISAIQYITAREKEDQAKKARTRIFEIVLGMIIWAVMWVAVNFLMPGGASN
jgi:hypothetical protein